MPSPLGVKLQDGALYIKGNHPTIDYSALEMLRETVKDASDDPSVRAISIDVSWDGVAEDMGNWPDRIAHRHPKGSHGPGPLVEQDTVRSIREMHETDDRSSIRSSKWACHRPFRSL